MKETNVIKSLSLTDKAGIFSMACPIDPDSSFDEIMSCTGFNFEVEKEQSFFLSDGKPTRGLGFQVVTNHDSPRSLGTVGNDYRPLQNREVFTSIFETAQAFGAVPDQAGLLDRGATCWLTFKLPSPISLKESGRPDDLSCPYILALANHDGTKNAFFKAYSTRYVCANQIRLIASSRDAGACFKVRHSTKAAERFAVAKSVFQKTLGKAKEYERFCNHLNSAPMAISEVENFAKQLLPASDELAVPTRTENMRSEIVDLFSNGQGNLGQSRWDALNAVTEWVDHKRSTRKTEGRSSGENRFVSAMIGGSGERIKEKAVKILSN